MLLGQCMTLQSQPKSIKVQSLEEANFLANRYALVIGNDHYEDSTISTLASCRLDAERMAAFLRSPKGYSLPTAQIKVLLDANRDQIIQQFVALLNDIEQPTSSTFYFYYSGHGLKGSIVPTDYKTDAPETALAYSWITSELKKRQIRAKVFIIDACYSGSAMATKDLETSTSSFTDAIIGNNAEENFIMYTATNAYRVTPAGRHESMYTKYFLSALSNMKTDSDQNGTLDSGELANELEKQLGRSNSPQFSGGTNFPMAFFGKNTQREIISSKSNHQRASGLVPIIKWRQQLKDQKKNQVFISEVIKELEAIQSAEARARLGFLYREGIGVTQDYQKSLTYFIPAAIKGNSFAMYNLGYLYAQGYGVTKNILKAIEYYEKAAAQGDVFAQHNLGCIFKLGDTHLVEIDLNKAIFWYQKSYDNGLAEAAFELGKLYQQQHSMTQAIEWFQKAAEMELAEAQFELARFYQEGIFIEPNKKVSTHWFNKACEHGFLRACSALMQSEL